MMAEGTSMSQESRPREQKVEHDPQTADVAPDQEQQGQPDGVGFSSGGPLPAVGSGFGEGGATASDLAFGPVKNGAGIGDGDGDGSDDPPPAKQTMPTGISFTNATDVTEQISGARNGGTGLIMETNPVGTGDGAHDQAIWSEGVAPTENATGYFKDEMKAAAHSPGSPAALNGASTDDAGWPGPNTPYIPIGKEGSYTWNIPTFVSLNGVKKSMGKVKQTFTVSKDGTSTVSKGDAVLSYKPPPAKTADNSDTTPTPDNASVTAQNAGNDDGVAFGRGRPANAPNK
jgi:hypothetical protein